MDHVQMNVRVDRELAEQIDERRAELRATMGSIPTRSDVIRMALVAYLSKPLKPGKPSG